MRTIDPLYCEAGGHFCDDAGIAEHARAEIPRLTAELEAARAKNKQDYEKLLDYSNQIMEKNAELADLRAKLERAEAERDAAVSDIEQVLKDCICECRHEFCKLNAMEGCGSDDCSDAKWRGLTVST